MNQADIVVANAAERLGAAGMVINVICDGKHSPASLHYVGLAKDYDVTGWSAAQIKAWADEVRENISAEYDVVAEPTHLHVEYQPKQNRRV